MKWSSSWKASKKPRKQRAYIRAAPLHVRSTLLGSHLVKELRQQLKTRSLRVRKGDKVKVVRGQFAGKIGVVDRVSTLRGKVFVNGVEFIKKDGSKSLYPVAASKVMIIELEGTDKRRLGGQK